MGIRATSKEKHTVKASQKRGIAHMAVSISRAPESSCSRGHVKGTLAPLV